ncbi:hypothetical protein [uncultured Gilvimarinus sp.]|uniref:hypothetical protein n=1 Tax=uncultured Gilvimarinus sp. TaxID=1689143 RepID=UPI0030DCA312
MSKPNLPEPEELLFTLDQLEQTTEVMSRVITRLKRQLSELSESSQQQPSHTSSKPRGKSRRTLH